MLPVDPRMIGAMAAPVLQDPESLANIVDELGIFLANRGVEYITVTVLDPVGGVSIVHDLSTHAAAEWFVAEIANTLGVETELIQPF